jgi:hypothetical protein
MNLSFLDRKCFISKPMNRDELTKSLDEVTLTWPTGGNVFPGRGPSPHAIKNKQDGGERC